MFEIIVDQLLETNKKYGIQIPYYVMTSEENNDETVDFFEKMDYFGYPKEAIKFFKQAETPLISKGGRLLIGEDNLKIFEKWFDYQYIIDNYSIYVYPRGAENKEEGYYQYKNIIRIKAPLFNISSTIIRDKLRTGKSISGLVPQNIEQEIYNYYNKGLIIV